MDFLSIVYALEADILCWYPVQMACDVANVLSPPPHNGAHFLASLLHDYQHVFGIPLCTPFIFRVFLIKMIRERLVPFLSALANAYNNVVKITELEEGAELWNPITQESVPVGIRPNGHGNSVLSLADLLLWVVRNGMRSPADNLPLETMDVVCVHGFNQDEVFDSVFRPFASYMVVPHHLEDCILALDVAAEQHTIAMAHANANEIMEIVANLPFMAQHERLEFAEKMIRFLCRWDVRDVLYMDTSAVRSVLPTSVIIVDGLFHQSYFVHEDLEYEVFSHSADEAETEVEEDTEDETDVEESPEVEFVGQTIVVIDLTHEES